MPLHPRLHRFQMLVEYTANQALSTSYHCFDAYMILQKHADAKCLLMQLEDIGVFNPKVALILLRLCGSFCKLVHLARAIPTFLSSKALMLFDADIRKTFCQCTGVDISDFAWQQAQLSLSRGGLGLHYLVHHSSAAFIASVCSSGFGPSLIYHLSKAVENFNSSVTPADDIPLRLYFNLHHPSQNCLTSWMIICSPQYSVQPYYQIRLACFQSQPPKQHLGSQLPHLKAWGSTLTHQCSRQRSSGGWGLTFLKVPHVHCVLTVPLIFMAIMQSHANEEEMLCHATIKAQRCYC